MKFLILGLIVIVGCSKTPIPVVPINCPTVSCSGKTPVEKVDPKTFSPENDGYYADLDGDGITDFAIMHTGVLSFKKGLGNGEYGEEIVILKIKGDVAAYRVDKYKDEKLPCLFFFDSEGNGYLQRNFGTNDKGLPYFGEVEQVE